ncbi:N-6 DNA methylase [Candidatus Gracilibacteria bacterium]|nr:N-6 DNA methylase [Candidatus Gracilibacteria bacterium]
MTNNNILQYESKVWKTADLLIGAGIKQSDFPKFMMPFFALIMVESRLIRMADEIRGDFKENEIEDFLDEIKDRNQGYNEFILRNNKSLKDICKNDKSFDTDFYSYLKSFDPETKNLLGVDKGNEEEKFLNISGVAGQLVKKKILFDTVKAWSEIDLKPFSNSEITTLEEHIKRKWADISAETAGEQYTPDDVISLISEIVSSHIKDGKEYLTIYDPTCGGGNMLFGVEDYIKEKFTRPTATYGQDWNDALYALAKIESRFREDSYIKYGNTLTDIRFSDKNFDVIIANPPYGVDWKGYEKDIKNDKTGRFKALPSISDGQFLFTQHIISQLDNEGIAVVVHNGSTLFSGDAGSGESEIRRYLFESDLVEAIIQLPTDEFFNTNIFTYLWVFNKNKSDERKDKVMLINAVDKYELLKKNKGKKRKEVDEKSRLDIIETLKNYKDNDYAKIFDKEYFYYNKQSIVLTNQDINGKSIEDLIPLKKGKDGELKRDKSIKLDTIKIIQEDIIIDNLNISTFNDSNYTDLKDYNDNYIKNLLSELDYKEKKLKVVTKESIYFYDEEKDTIIKETNGKIEELGCGKIVIKSSYKKATKTKEASIEITVELTPDYEKDYEIIPYSKDEEQNKRNITEFLDKYINKPFEYGDNVIGVEINFNKVFYKPEELRDINDIIGEIKDLDDKLKFLESNLGI